MRVTNAAIRDFTTEIPGQITDDGLTWRFPTVKGVNSHGREIQWTIMVSAIDTNADDAVPTRGTAFLPVLQFMDNKPITIPGIHGQIRVETGLVGGKVRDGVPTTVAVGKSIGRRNETNTICQALRDAYGKYTVQARRTAHVPVLDDDTVLVLYPPMLAQTLEAQKRKKPMTISVKSPVYVQRKYNGVRAVVTFDTTAQNNEEPNTKNVIMYSRKRLAYSGFRRVKEELFAPLQKYIVSRGSTLFFDGEIYKHGARLQDISGLARRDDGDEETAAAGQREDIGFDESDCTYMIYDCFDPRKPDLIFTERRAILTELLGVESGTFISEKNLLTNIEVVETFKVTTHANIQRYYEMFLGEGYEGAMIRINTVYTYSINDRHTTALLKMKPVHDGEYEIVGHGLGGKGKAFRSLMVNCKTAARDSDDGGEIKEGIPFAVTPAMEIAEREALAAKMIEVEANGRTHFDNHWRGKMLIVYYDELSRDGVPQRGRTKMEIRTWD